MKDREGLRVEARSLFCYSAVCDLGVSVTDGARLLGMAASSVSYAVRRGRTVAEKKGFQIGKKELLNN
jgi:mannose/cellobiose epimerase-like protein (N-acyl-D-glucosamine 2-epimerase family)